MAKPVIKKLPVNLRGIYFVQGGGHSLTIREPEGAPRAYCPMELVCKGGALYYAAHFIDVCKCPYSLQKLDCAEEAVFCNPRFNPDAPTRPDGPAVVFTHDNPLFVELTDTALPYNDVEGAVDDTGKALAVNGYTTIVAEASETTKQFGNVADCDVTECDEFMRVTFAKIVNTDSANTPAEPATEDPAVP